MARTLNTARTGELPIGMASVLAVSLLYSTTALASPTAKLCRRSVCGAAVLGALRPANAGAPAASDLSSLLDEVEAPRADGGVVALRKRAEAEARQMAERDAVALRRMKAVEEAREREREALAASGVPPCPTGGPFGDAGRTGVLTAKVCARQRDGTIETAQRTGAFLVF